MATRTQAREVVVQLLYAYGSGNEGISKFVDEILSEHKIKNAQSEFAKVLFNGVVEHLKEIDLRIKHQVKNWDFERIGGMERAILRLGVYEIIFNGMNKAIVINEALELAKNFSNEASVKFINGILDGIAKNASINVEIIEEALQKIQKEQGAKNLPQPKAFKKDLKITESKISGTKNKASTKVTFAKKDSKGFKSLKSTNKSDSKSLKAKKDSLLKKAEK